jgi:hypothetical protein
MAAPPGASLVRNRAKTRITAHPRYRDMLVLRVEKVRGAKKRWGQASFSLRKATQSPVFSQPCEYMSDILDKRRGFSIAPYLLFRIAFAFAFAFGPGFGFCFFLCFVLCF